MLDTKTNQLLLANVINKIILPLNDIVEWDRYALREYDGFIFGWIKREDGFYDFVNITFELLPNGFAKSFNTSSKKYSKEIARRLTEESIVISEHIDCKPASDIPHA